MASKKALARSLVQLAVQHGVEDAVICHGSRNAPLILSLSRQEELRCYPLADERSAAFFALGIAQQSGDPVIVTCSSGTAALNMAPAAAEAFYQRIPLILVTADRPDEWIDQMDGQTIRQQGVFEPHVRRSVHLPLEAEEGDRLWSAQRNINEALNTSKYPVPGPVHINVPFREPLYELEEEASKERPRSFRTAEHRCSLSEEAWAGLEEEWERAERVLVLAGSDDPDPERDEKLEELARERKLIVWTETLANLRVPSAIQHIDRTLKGVDPSEESALAPDLLISTGGAVVSKMAKAFLRKAAPKAHWRVDPSGEAIDTYQHLSRILPVGAGELFEKMLSWEKGTDKEPFVERWLSKADEAVDKHRDSIEDVPWSDLKAFERILEKVPANSELHAGNSSPVRYLQLLGPRTDLLHRGNRGTSGIDGVISTAAGAASRSDSFVTAISGDIGFFYDSNALWNPSLPSNLRIIVINNGGGGIFRIIEGPSGNDELGEFFEGTHELNAEGIARTFGLAYYFCDDPEGLEQGLDNLYVEEGAAVLEVRTPRETNDRVLREHFRKLEPKPSS